MSKLNDKRTLYIAIKKDKETNDYKAILSDDSVDRDDEYMSPDMLKEWAQNEAMPMLADHDNAMNSFIGVWKDPKFIEKDGRAALMMTPNFLSKDANPKAEQIKKQIDEASALGMNVGVSVGFIPLDGEQTERGYMITKGELVEGTIVPVQSNRNANIGKKSYDTIANNFGLRGVDMTTKDKKKNKQEGDETSTTQEVVDGLASLTTAVEANTETVNDTQDAIEEVAGDIKAVKKALKMDDSEDDSDEEKEDDPDKEDDDKPDDEKSKEILSLKAKVLKAEKKVKALIVEKNIKGKVTNEVLGVNGVSKDGEPEKDKAYDAANDYLGKKGMLPKEDK